MNRKRRKGLQRISSCKLVFVLFMFGFLNNKTFLCVVLEQAGTDIDEYQDWFHAVTGTRGAMVFEGGGGNFFKRALLGG